MGRELSLNNPKQVTIQQEVKKTVSNLKIIVVKDDGGCVMVDYSFDGGGQSNLVLWDENTTPSYAEIGQWTDDDVDARLIELL